MKALLETALFALLASAAQAEPAAHPVGWLRPPPRVQLEMDPQLIPIGKGAIFVPAMSEPAVEPQVLIVAPSGEEVAQAPTGQKIILPPGHYEVRVGSGVLEQQIRMQAEVHEGHTTLIEPEWAGLIVRVVDTRGIQFRGTYEVFALPVGEDYGLGLGADETLGESLRTWLLRPGRYMIVRSGESPRARTDFLTVRLAPGELIHFTLVQDQQGTFHGGGVVDRWEGRTEIQNWRVGLIVGGDLLWNRNDHVPGRASGNSTTFNAFVDTSLRYLDPNHLFYMRLQLDEGGQAFQDMGADLSDLQLSKTLDELDFDALYTYRLLSWLGPYVRFGMNSNLFPGVRRFDPPNKDVVVLDRDLNLIERKVSPKLVDLAGSFDPLELKEGFGVSFDISPSLLFDIHLRVGVGARHTVVRSLLIEREASPDLPACADAVCLVQATPSNLLGAEATLIGSVRLFRWVLLDTELDSLLPFIASGSGSEPVVTWKNTLSLRLVSFASVAYVTNLAYNKQLSEELQFEQRVLLRFTFDIF